MKKVVNDKLEDVSEKDIELHNSKMVAAATCNGNACAYVTVTSLPTGSGCRFSNSSDKPVKMSVQFAFGLGCMSATSFTIAPHSFSDFGNGGFCNPYTANF